MNVSFVFALNARVRIVAHEVTASVTSASTSRSGGIGYWVEYLDAAGVVRETYVPEAGLEAA